MPSSPTPVPQADPSADRAALDTALTAAVALLAGRLLLGRTGGLLAAAAAVGTKLLRENAAKQATSPDPAQAPSPFAPLYPAGGPGRSESGEAARPGPATSPFTINDSRKQGPERMRARTWALQPDTPFTAPAAYQESPSIAHAAFSRATAPLSTNPSLAAPSGTSPRAGGHARQDRSGESTITATATATTCSGGLAPTCGSSAGRTSWAFPILFHEGATAAPWEIPPLLPGLSPEPVTIPEEVAPLFLGHLNRPVESPEAALENPPVSFRGAVLGVPEKVAQWAAALRDRFGRSWIAVPLLLTAAFVPIVAGMRPSPSAPTTGSTPKPISPSPASLSESLKNTSLPESVPTLSTRIAPPLPAPKVYAEPRPGVDQNHAPGTPQALARAALEKVLAARTREELLPYVLDPDGLEATLAAYPPGTLRPVEVRSLFFESSLDLPNSGKTAHIFRLVTEDLPMGFPTAVEQAGDEFRLNWEALVQCRDTMLERFLSNRAAPPGRFFVVLVRQSQYLGQELPGVDPLSWRGCKLLPVTAGGAAVQAAVPLDSPLGRMFDTQKEWEKTYAPVVDLAHVGSQVVITKLIRESWRASAAGSAPAPPPP